MRFKFFNQAGDILFERNDDETASVVHEELSLQILYPYDENKVIQRGMLVGYTDVSGSWQVFEIRKAKLYEPDHYQEITAEHICIAELTDEHFKGAEWTNITASAALAELLDGTGWAVGTDTSEGVSSANVSMSNVWQDVRSIENNWNVYILPRVTVGTNGITGRYLDIIPAGGTWRGLRLSLEKNADELGVTWDDSKVKTALYAYGKSESTTVDGQKVSAPITFEDVVWEATADHPAKPAGQAYLVDPDATAAFGRNGRPRFGYYQNGDISDPEILLEKTWESLKTLNHPDVTIDSLVTDLYRLGYNDVPIRLHDMALTEIRPTGVILSLEIIQFTEDLNDPLQSRVTIGTYIPNIIYINRETKKAAGGGGGGGGGQNDGEFQDSLFVTNIQANELGLVVTSAELAEAKSTIVAQGAQLTIDRTGINSLAVGTGAQLNADGTLVVDAQGKPIFTTEGSGLYSNFTQTASEIRSTVSAVDGRVSEIKQTVDGITLTGNTITIKGNSIDLDGYTTLQAFQAEQGRIDAIYAGTAQVSGLYSTGGITALGFVTAGTYVNSPDVQISGTSLKNAISGIGTATYSGGSVSIPTTKINGTAGPSINFNIADTQYYKDGVSAAKASVRITSATRTSQSNSELSGDSSVGTAGYKYIVITATADNNATRTIMVNATPTFTNGVTEGESHFVQATVTPQGASAGTVYLRKTGGSIRVGSSTTIHQRGTAIYFKSHPRTETPTSLWYSMVGSASEATQTYYTSGSDITAYPTSSSGTYYYLGDGTRTDLYEAGTPDTTTYYTRTSS
jgi:phage minor structural protein